MNDNVMAEIQFDERGLIPAIAVDVDSNRVLMMAWMNRESIEVSIEEKRATYYSRSRQALWRKGESSGNEQQLVDIYLDCDGDTLMLAVKQRGVACHTGRASCFYRRLTESGWQDTLPIKMDPAALYGGKHE